MRRGRLSIIWLALLLPWFTGCRCCLLFEPYNDLIDDLKDYYIPCDNYYCPQLDISRAGKPDWCGPINRVIGRCRCDCTGHWTRYDEIWRYPPRTPYDFPNHSFPGPSQYAPKSAPLDSLEEDSMTPLLPAEAAPPAPIPPEN